ncbi:PH domain-containing protein [Streptomyces bambusae]|uniref:PH domain-containing protein n=1 Tax=Streptomyces bambusae TaxID=1550616 RepID=UPI001CFC739A|nr:PH domain-containing protein [Streptomyces bambusae]MCB5168645.1 PH domain-containing protein [Streptomyces bambusae]
MTSPQQPHEEPAYADRVYRSNGALVAGVLLLAFGLWICGDAVVRGSGRTPWFALAGFLTAAPLVVAYTLRPAVFANEDRLKIRNPFRTIELPWASVAAVRARYSAEALVGDATYQLWAIPVSLRQRKAATRRNAKRKAAGEDVVPGQQDEVSRAVADQHVKDLAEIHEQAVATARPGAQGEPAIRWTYELIAPAVAGALLLAVLFATR